MHDLCAKYFDTLFQSKRPFKRLSLQKRKKSVSWLNVLGWLRFIIKLSKNPLIIDIYLTPLNCLLIEKMDLATCLKCSISNISKIFRIFAPL